MLTYTKHAKKRMEERSIIEGHIHEVLARPEIEYPSFGCTVAIRALEGRKVGVVYVKKGTKIVVVTVTLGDEGP